MLDEVPPEYLEASKKSLAKQQWAAFEARVRSVYKQMARISIVPEWAKLPDFETRLPIAVEELVSGQYRHG